MMHRILQKSICCAVVLLLCCCRLQANQGLGISLISYTLDTVDLGYTITINAELRNFDSVPFGGLVDFGLHNNTHANLTTTGIFNQPPYSGKQISLYPHEVVPAVFSIHIDPQYFAPGPDVVVVWPICTQPIADSIVINIEVKSPSGIGDRPEELFGYIIVNDRIFLKNNSVNTNFKQVRIYNLLGQQTFELRGDNITEVQLPALPKGLYLAEFVTADNKRKVIRFFR